MSLKDALSTDLSARGLNLGALADKLGISQQSISKWIAADKIPHSRHAEVAEFLGRDSATVAYLSRQKMAELEALVEIPAYMRGQGEEPIEAPLFSRRAPEESKPQEPAPRSWFKLNIFGDKDSLAAARPFRPSMGVAEHLEPLLRRYADRHIELNGQDRRFDYLSATVAVKVVFGHPGWLTLNPWSFSGILLLRATRDETRCVIAQLPSPRNTPAYGADRKPSPMDLKRAGQFASDMALLGIDVLPFDNYAALAEQIEAWELIPGREWQGHEDY